MRILLVSMVSCQVQLRQDLLGKTLMVTGQHSVLQLGDSVEFSQNRIDLAMVYPSPMLQGPTGSPGFQIFAMPIDSSHLPTTQIQNLTLHRSLISRVEPGITSILAMVACAVLLSLCRHPSMRLLPLAILTMATTPVAACSPVL